MGDLGSIALAKEAKVDKTKVRQGKTDKTKVRKVKQSKSETEN